MTTKKINTQPANDNGSERAALASLIPVLARAVGRSVAKQQFEVWLKTAAVTANDNPPKEPREQKS